jgi:hypothetical protein
LKSEGALRRRSPAGLASSRAREDKAFRLLVIGVSLAFAWILWPLYGAVLWATVAAIQFAEGP